MCKQHACVYRHTQTYIIIALCATSVGSKRVFAGKTGLIGRALACARAHIHTNSHSHTHARRRRLRRRRRRREWLLLLHIATWFSSTRFSICALVCVFSRILYSCTALNGSTRVQRMRTTCQTARSHVGHMGAQCVRSSMLSKLVCVCAHNGEPVATICDQLRPGRKNTVWSCCLVHESMLMTYK